jgi:chromate reductase
LPTRILAISGSLRAASSNTAVLRAAARLAPEDVELTLYGGLGELPHFNADLDGDDPPPRIVDLRRQVRTSDGVLISSPEYAHGVPGSMKNALDWLVGSMDVVGKPVALLNAAPRATLAQESLAETLETISATVVAEACVALPILGSGLDEDGIAAHPEISRTLRSALEVFVGAIRSG